MQKQIKAAEILKPYLDAKFMPFEPLQGAHAKIDDWEVDSENKIALRIVGTNDKKFEYSIEKSDLDSWLCENFTIEETVVEEVVDAVVQNDTEKSISNMRTLLEEVISDLKEGKMDVVKAKAVGSITQTWLNSFKIELDYQKHMGNKSHIKQLDK